MMPASLFSAVANGMLHAPHSRMNTTRPSLRPLLGIATIGVLAALVACTSTTTAQDTETSDPASGNEAPGEGARRLDSGGTLVAPFTCAVDAIQGEPRPGAPLLEQLRVAAGLDALVLFVRRDGTTEERAAIENQRDACT